MRFDEYGRLISFSTHRNPLLRWSSVTHFSMWALLKSPLMLGHDLLNTVRSYLKWSKLPATLIFLCQSNETWTIITNTAIIAINQDVNGQPGIRLLKTPLPEGGSLQLWRSELMGR